MRAPRVRLGRRVEPGARRVRDGRAGHEGRIHLAAQRGCQDVLQVPPCQRRQRRGPVLAVDEEAIARVAPELGVVARAGPERVEPDDALDLRGGGGQRRQAARCPPLRRGEPLAEVRHLLEDRVHVDASRAVAGAGHARRVGPLEAALLEAEVGGLDRAPRRVRAVRGAVELLRRQLRRRAAQDGAEEVRLPLVRPLESRARHRRLGVPRGVGAWVHGYVVVAAAAASMCTSAPWQRRRRGNGDHGPMG
eukprot:7385600-Prymnesium_polylepis.2